MIAKEVSRGRVVTVAVDMELPAINGLLWHVAVDTWKASPEDILEPSEQNWFREKIYPVQPRSIIVLEARPPSHDHEIKIKEHTDDTPGS